MKISHQILEKFKKVGAYKVDCAKQLRSDYEDALFLENEIKSKIENTEGVVLENYEFIDSVRSPCPYCK
jgi:hypothetical protein